jgi:hypothetical protein
MPAPRRAILSDISDKNLNPHQRLVVDRDGRLRGAKSSTTVVPQHSQEFAAPAPQTQEAFVSLEVVEETSNVSEVEDKNPLTQVEEAAVPAATEDADTNSVAKPSEKPKAAAKGKSRKKVVQDS